MPPDILDNPIWHALTTSQAKFALGGDRARRFPRQVAPFVAVPSESTSDAELAQLTEQGESVCLVGVAPRLSSWKVEKQSAILQMLCGQMLCGQMLCEQMICSSRSEPDASAGISQLSEADLGAILGLTALVYPAYFRARTVELGDYFGIYQDGRLAAMAGERLHPNGYQEISAVCTHPDFQGRGYAGRLVAHLANRILERGETPFLHVDAGNTRATSVYERLGFKARRSIPLWVIRRPAIA